ncbi:SRPBCC family protein [Alicyclobacillus shizuokensis]|uniref:SRPBCC family protein n=1 Tax=Alicyclobacillus shizuokensis TaxID=392014 RepID=UPI0008368AA9|nr:SRPBCC domain-containing protein [Alicyclobacillus shizuokensis]
MKSLSLDFRFKSPIEKVWFALTDSNTLSKWMMFRENDFKPVVGHKFQFRMEPTGGWNGIIEGEVLEVDEPHRLSYTWVSAGESNTVTWTLKQDEDGTTHVHLDQTDISSEQALSGATYGWQSMAKQLENVLAEL